jgi:hypothetical protein
LLNVGVAGVVNPHRLFACVLAVKGDEMKKGASLSVDKKPSGSSGYTWRDKTIYILTAILCVQALLIFVWMPRCWRLRFFGVDSEQSPYTIEETTIGGKLSARNIKNTLTGISLRFRACFHRHVFFKPHLWNLAHTMKLLAVYSPSQDPLYTKTYFLFQFSNYSQNVVNR